jgi:two-component system cell cycle sensor histidine kinase/response regulator CckA
MRRVIRKTTETTNVKKCNQRQNKDITKPELTHGLESLEKSGSSRNPTEALLREATTQLQLIFQNMINAFIVWESVLDEHDRFVSFRFGYFNDAYAHITKLKLDDVQGKDIFEVWPETEKSWIDAYAEVAITGLPRTFEMYHKPTNGLYHCNAYRPGATPDYVCVVFEDITEQNRAAEVLKDSEEKYRALIETTDTGYVILNHNGNVLDANRKYLRLSGHQELDEIRGRNVTEWTAQYDADRNAQAVIKCFKQGFIRDLRIDYTDKTGRLTPIEINATVIETSTGAQIVTLCRDITERRRAEEALKESENKYRLLADNSADVIFVCDLDLNFQYVSPSIGKLRGFAPEEIIGHSMSQSVTAESLEFLRKVIGKELGIERTGTADPKRTRIAELEMLCKNGSTVRTEVKASFLRNDDNTPIGVMGIIRDITERNQAENELRKSEEKFKKMFEGSPIGMIMAGADFRFIRANAAFCRMLSYTEQELVSLTFKDITHPEHIAEDVLHVDDLVSGKIPLYQTEKRYVRKDKGVVWGSSTVNIVRDRDNRFLYSLITVEDITQRMQSEEERMRLESQLQQAQKMEAIGTLAGGIAHDFNNILTALLGYAALLRMKIKDTTLRTYVDHILSASHKATDLVQNLLAFSKQQAISIKPISLHNIIKGTEKLLNRLVTEDIAIRTHLADEDIIIMADATQIDQILFNLATNARDAMPQGGTFTIETRAVELGDEFKHLHGYGEPGRYALLCISDTGVGIDATIREKIFDPFFTTKEVGKGTGLGLSTVYGIVKQHNGYLTVYSEPGIGTTFRIYLPVANKIGKEENLALTRMKGGTETILIAEDSDAVRDLISKILIEYGYRTIEAIDGTEAVEQFKKAEKIDLLILDSIMPKKNGREAYNEITKIKPDIGVIFTSGYTRDIFLDKGIEDKNFNFLPKPISPDTLLQKVREVLDNRQGSH